MSVHAAEAAPPAEPERRSYTETIPGTSVSFEMVFIPGGTFTMGSPPKEKGRGKNEGPTRQVTVRPFWMSRTEVTWDAYAVFLNIGLKKALETDGDEGPDALTYPTPPYSDETFGYGKENQPAIALTHHAVSEYARWLSSQTGKTYRLPAEAEWEYACRGGTSTPYPFGSSPARLAEHAWFASNSEQQPRAVGQKKLNPFGLLDMHGNTAEWVLDQYDPSFYGKAFAGELPVNLPGDRRYSHVVRGGGWRDKAPALRCAARRFSEKWWSTQDPQSPQSIWWHTEAVDVGFRIVRPLEEYPALERFRSKMRTQSGY